MQNKKPFIIVIILVISLLLFILVTPKLVDIAIETQKRQTQKLFENVEKTTSEEMEKLYDLVAPH